MPSATEPTTQSNPPQAQQWREAFEVWNRRLHFYVGLYLLFFIWLFTFTGLLLNHPTWTFDEFWNSRKQSSFEREIVLSVASAEGDLGRARDVLRQLGISGEIEWTTTRKDDNQFDFRVSRPGHIYEVKADLARKRVIVQQSDVNLWGVMRMLHTFTGVKMGDARSSRDWALTAVWAFSMDAVAVGLIFMVLSSLYMWYALGQKRLLGALFLGLGSAVCALFCVGLRWLY